MSDRRSSYQYPSNNMQWNNASAPYSPTADYSSTQYQNTLPSASAHSMGQVYNGETPSPTSDSGYSSSYYSSNPYNTSAGYRVYPSATGQAADDSATLYGQRHSHHSQITRPQSTHPYATSGYAQSPTSQTYAYPHYASSGQSRGSYSQSQAGYISPPTSPTSYSSSANYPPQIPLTPASTSPQYPATPSRPFACDLCTLSFNRQHDLKRHRETHSGEKPYFCNGGCRKTFTRKDALKRHQLVKGCGKPDEPWSGSSS